MDEEKTTPAIDKVIHERARLLILTHLATLAQGAVASGGLRAIRRTLYTR